MFLDENETFETVENGQRQRRLANRLSVPKVAKVTNDELTDQ